MRFFSYIADALRTIMANKMRSGLSTLGIIIWVMSVVVLMAFGKWAEMTMMENMWDMMKNTIMLSPWWGYSMMDEEWGAGNKYIKKVTFDEKLVNYIEEYFPELKWKIQYSARLKWDSMVKVWSTQTYADVQWVPESYYELQELELEKWSRLTKRNYENKEMVAVVSYWFLKQLNQNKQSSAKKINIDNIIWTKVKLWWKEVSIVGLLKQTSEWEWSTMYLPITTMWERLNHNNEISSLTIHLEPTADNAKWQKRITYLLLKKYNIPSKQQAWFSIYSFAKYTEQLNSSMAIMNYLLLAIWAISLLVGWIWVMNIMIVSVTERTREIWIRKAIWALDRDIIAQFLVESVIIVVIGWLIALWLSFWIVAVLNKAFANTDFEFKAVITYEVVLVALWLTTAIGIIFWILPARKAAKLKPIDALRFE